MKILALLTSLLFLVSCGNTNSSEKEQVTEPHFKLIETKEVKNLGATSYTFEHIKTGARVIYLDDENDEKVFGIAFKTPVVDDTGVNHVFEHSVLAGSKKYPDKTIFSGLDTKNIPTFLNAMTGSDYTLYPFSAIEPKSFDNLLDVYLDAVFNPLVLEDQNILDREGWRYDRNPATNEIIYNGIVYNEMKGVFSNPFSTLSQKMNLIVYPDEKANYRFVSGGLPSAIPNLNIDQLRKTHAKYYTPSNSVVVLGGKLDINKKLAKLDEYFSKYDRSPKAVIEVQETTLKDVFHNETYPGPNGSPNLYIYTTLMEKNTSTPELLFITSLLADYEISPLKKLFKENKFTGNFGFYNDTTIQPRGYMMIQGADEKEMDKFRRVMDAKIVEVAEKGIDQKIIDLALRDYKKELAKSQYSSERAADLTSSIARGMFYYEKPLLLISDEKIKLLEKLAGNPEKIKALIKKYYVDNHNKVEIFFTPDPSELKQIAVDEKIKLKKYDTSLSVEEHKLLDKKIESFNLWAKTPTDKATSDKTPKISLTDLKDSKIQTVDTTVETVEGVKIINNDINTYDINLTSLKFDASGFTSQDKINGDLFSILMTSSSTADYTYEDLSENLTKYFFALNASNSNNIIDNKHTSRKYSVYFEYLQEDNKEVYKTLENILFKGNFDNKVEIKNRLSAVRDSIINNSSDSGVIRSLSVMKAMAMTDSNYTYSLENKIAGKYTSTLMLDTLNAILKNYDVEYPKLQKTMIATREKLFNKTNMVVFYANRGNYENFKTDITPLLSNIKTEVITPTNYGKLEPNKLAIVVPVQNGSTSWANNLENLGYNYSGKYKVMANILDDYLNTNIRIQNGAYGAWFYITLSKNLIATTYRDGEVDKTLKAFTLMPEYLSGLEEMPQDVFDGFVLKSMAKYYQSYTPDQLMNLSYTHYLYNITLDDLENEKNEVLATTKEDLPEFETIITKFIAAKHYSTVNSKAIIKEKGSNSQFDKIIDFKDIK